MRQSFIVTHLIVLAFAFTLPSCKQTSIISDPINTSPDSYNPDSEVDLMERETGVRYFKRDTLLRDPTDQTEIYMRFASTSEDALRDQLSRFDYKVKAVYPSSNDGSKVEKTVNGTSDTRGNRNSAISVIIEPLTIKLPKNAVGYNLSMSGKLISSKNAKPLIGTYHSEILSPFWTEYVDIRVNSTWIEFTLDSKTRTGNWNRFTDPKYYTSGGHIFAAEGGGGLWPLAPPGPDYWGAGFNFTNYIDGPYRHKAHIFYDDPNVNWGVTWRANEA